MEGDIKVSIICNAYNHEKYIRDALESFLKQKTDFTFEVLVHDDASTDNTPNIIREYEQKYPDIIKPIYQTENQYSKRKGIIGKLQRERAQGKYIALCEGDDYWTDPNKLQEQYDYMEDHDECSLVVHEALTYYCNTGIQKKYVECDFSKPENQTLTPQQIIDNHLLFPTASMFFRKSFYINNERMFDGRGLFDYGVKILLATEGTVHVIPKVMSIYRCGTENSWTKTVLKGDKKKYIKHLEHSLTILKDINEYRNYKFDKELKKAIEKREFLVLLAKKDLKAIKKEPYKKFYRQMSFRKRVRLTIEVHFPWVKTFYEKIKK